MTHLRMQDWKLTNTLGFCSLSFCKRCVSCRGVWAIVYLYLNL